MTRRRWIADQWTDTTAALTGDQAAHLARVLRAQVGMEFDIVAGGRVWHSVVAEVSDLVVRFNLITELEAEPALPITVLLSIFKFDRLEWAIEKATELGVARIVPVVARRTETHLAQAAAKRVERWRRLAKEAAQQSRRSDTPEVLDPLPLKLALQQFSAELNDKAVRIVLAEQEQTTTLKRALDEALASRYAVPQIILAIGPEGGWASEEEKLFDQTGWKPVTLGPRILRAETATIAALSVVASLLE